MDGTIVTTEHIWIEAGKRLVERRGIVYTDELRNTIVPLTQGLSTHKSTPIIKEIAKLDDDVDLLIKEKAAIAHELYLGGISFIQGFVEFHAQVVKNGYKTAIATNACDQTVQLTEQALTISQFFGQHIYGISCVGGICKPDPAVYLHAARSLGVDPSECIVFEDSAHGVNAALAAGMYCIGINSSGDLSQIARAHRAINGYCELDIDLI